MMTPEERSSIGNAMWLCATHADLVDRDTVLYTAALLHEMKAEHEGRCRDDLARQEASSQILNDLVAIGPDVIAVARVQDVQANLWSFVILDYIIGDQQTLVASIGAAAGNYDNTAYNYVLANAHDDGRVLSAPASLSMTSDGYIVVVCPVRPPFSRMDARLLPTDLALSDENDLVLKDGDLATVRGLEAVSQRIRTCLSIQRGEMHFEPNFGTRLDEYYRLMLGSPWLSHMFKLETIRQAAIPLFDTGTKARYTPLLCVERVRNVDVLASKPNNSRLPIRLHLRLKGIGDWIRETWVYMPET